MPEDIRRYEKEHLPLAESDPYRLRFHLMPPVGWLNDPNGLCQHRGIYHVFFQYSPYEVNGGKKFWGHYTSKDLLDWNYEGVALSPDRTFDQNGVYSGSAFSENGKLHLFYTGNVKLKGDYDYIRTGRQGNTIAVASEDGIHFGEKQFLMGNEDYPDGYTCHIRDPKVFAADGCYYMVLGGRTNEDRGTVLLYRSADLKNWELAHIYAVPEAFGYMWECPDMIRTDSSWYLAVSPQGLTREEYRFQNIYQSGYFQIVGEFQDHCRLENFREWDMGFDFYAPQTFVDESGRRILIGWAGMPDSAEEYTNPTAEKGWQHALTVPRQILEREGRLLQYPVAELERLREEARSVQSGEVLRVQKGCFDLLIEGLKNQACEVEICEGLKLICREGEAMLLLGEEAGRGRDTRKARLEHLDEIRVLADTSLIEIYLNHGETVFTTRFYPETTERSVRIQAEGAKATLYEMRAMKINYSPVL